MNKLSTLFIALLIAVVASAQQQGANWKFSPEKFRAEMEKFITTEAGLTPQEASRFFPLLREMTAKQRTLYTRQRQLAKIKPADEKGCRDAIRKNDEMDVEIKELQRSYHNKMLSVLPASKLYDVLKAVDRFHRNELRKWGGAGRHTGYPSHRQQHPGVWGQHH